MALSREYEALQMNVTGFSILQLLGLHGGQNYFVRNPKPILPATLTRIFGAFAHVKPIAGRSELIPLLYTRLDR